MGEWPGAQYNAAPYQAYEAYGLIPEADPTGTPQGSAQGLPPMSSLRPNGAQPPSMSGASNNAAFVPHADTVAKTLGAVRKNFSNSIIVFGLIQVAVNQN